MGGYGSGYRLLTRKHDITLDDCLFLDVNLLMRLGAITESSSSSGVWKWVNPRTGVLRSSVRYEANTLNMEVSYLRLIYRLKETGQILDYEIKILRTHPPYGGVRFWFECPVTKKRVAKLYFMPHQYGIYVSRHASRIYYASQVRGKMDRAFDRKWKLMDNVDGDTRPIRPTGMHSKTFQRILDKFMIQEGCCNKMIAKALKL